MTIALTGYTLIREYIVTVSDARLSQGDTILALDDGAMKNRKIASTWGMMFAGNAGAFVPVVADSREALADYQDKGVAPAEVVKTAVQRAYEKEFQERFFRQHLAKLGYSRV